MSWKEFAACKGLPTALFFPENGKVSSEIIEMCEDCSVQIECLADAFRFPSPEDHGIRGGVTARTRRKMRRTGIPIGLPRKQVSVGFDDHTPISLRYDSHTERYERI